MPVAFGEKIVVFCALYLPHFHRACVEPRLLQPLLFHYLDNEHTSINDLRFYQALTIVSLLQQEKQEV